MSKYELGPFERVRSSTQRVMKNSKLVSFEAERLEALANELDPAQIRARHSFNEDFHFVGGAGSPDDEERLINYVFTVTALNFGSGLSPLWKKLEDAQLVQGSLYKTVADTLRREVLAGNNLEATWAAEATAASVAKLFGLPADFELVAMFAHSLSELGQWVQKAYRGKYRHLLEMASDGEMQPSAAALVEQVVGNLACFRDEASYEGEPVYFYKRAQILVNDLYLAFKGRGWGAFGDITELTMFADNLLPHFFRMQGVLTYAPPLAEAIEGGELIEAGSVAEVEMRAGAVQCVERVTARLNELYPSDTALFPAQLDVYLWNFSQSATIKARPRHRTVTYFY